MTGNREAACASQSAQKEDAYMRVQELELSGSLINASV